MGNLSAIFILLVIAFYVAIIFFYFWGSSQVGKAAERKLRNRRSFFWLSLVFSPLITALIVATLPYSDLDPKNPKNKLVQN